MIEDVLFIENRLAIKSKECLPEKSNLVLDWHDEEERILYNLFVQYKNSMGVEQDEYASVRV
jgi:hypothetical protein